ncbi:alpha/beta hydrolase [Streptomyces europaeiscabiei]|uniref:alpha/beta fold hydrolase n=1 Tax=Streptomyces europaeiscabiei TaxID=146819 RepID=UPI002E18BEC5
MPLIAVNGIRLNYEDQGSGQPVVMLMGSGSSGRVWHLHQVPALVSRGYRVITLDNRGIKPSDECPGGFTVEDMVGDTAALIEALGLGRCLLVGTSLGAQVAQELALARPDLVDKAVLMATRGRTDAVRGKLAQGEIDLYESGVTLPPRYEAAVRAMLNLSPRTLNDQESVSDWLDLFEMTPKVRVGERSQLGFSAMPDRLRQYEAISRPCHVIAFADDRITPAHLGREVADRIPCATFEVIPDCGHYGYLEAPEAVNKSLVRFFESGTGEEISW